MQKRLILMSLALVVLTSCGTLSSPVAPVAPSNVVAPSGVNEANASPAVDAATLVMTSVRAHQAGFAPNAGWVVLSTDTRQVDLLSFQGSLAPLADVAITAGAYDSLSLSLTAGCTVVVNGVTQPLDAPGALGLSGSFDLPSSGVLTLQLDLNANHSIHETGNGRWKLKPSIPLVNAGVVANPAAVSDGDVTGGTRGHGKGGGTNLPHDLVD